jgi:hypothetical protein
MKRKEFLQTSALFSIGSMLLPGNISFAQISDNEDLAYRLFKNPPAQYHPYVRWWWNGDKVEKAELTRELELLKTAGIGGVEINPIQFPQHTDDMGRRSLVWLSDEWIEMLDHTLKETKRLGLTADLLVGSGWPFGAEFLQGEERAEIITIGVKKIEGEFDFEISLFDLIKIADPSIVSLHSRREPLVQKVYLVPDPMTSLDQVKDLSDQIPNGFIKVSIPLGRWAIYAQVITRGFQSVLNGAPGANGPVLNHFNKEAVEKYLNHMTDTIQQKIGPLKGRLRAFFTDSLEVEGANWCSDMAEEFKKRRGYDILPYLPFILFKFGGMGSVSDYNYGVAHSDDFRDVLERIRLDFKITMAELFYERFCLSFETWCKKNGVQSRVQPYGRGYHIVDGALTFDIPEGETWVRPHSGKDMPENNPGWGRSYDMMNKYVTSAAHLNGKRLISCEECTNTSVVFSTTLQLLKLCSDQSLISGVTHSVYHGFNYSPPDAPFPGWIRYGNFMNERNTYWPYFKYLNEYKARISALLQQADFYSDIALLPCEYDAWSKYGDWLDVTSKYFQKDEDFREIRDLKYIALLWEAIHHNGNACDFVSEKIIAEATMQNGLIQFGNKKYHTLFLLSMEIMDESTAKKILEFLKCGGKVFCIDRIPSTGVGFHNKETKSKALKAVMDEIISYKDKFIFLKKPDSDYIGWVKSLQQQYNIKPYITIDGVNPFIQQIRYSTKDFELIFVTNSSYNNSYEIKMSPDGSLIKDRQAYVWDAVSGDRYRLDNNENWDFTLYPADSKIIVCENSIRKDAKAFREAPQAQDNFKTIDQWEVEFIPINNGEVRKVKMSALKDLKDTEFMNFTGKIIYRNSFRGNADWLDLGVVQGLSDVKVNGKEAGVRWYGRHIYSLKKLVNNDLNTVEIGIVVVMCNYMKSLKDNPIAQGWTRNQSIQSMGLMGPVMVF